jgi:predicted RNA-binding protein with PUA-like domain
MAFWLMKSEPFKYPWSQLVDDKRTAWDGVRNFEARNNLRAMKRGDLALFYHSNEGKEIVGIVRIAREAYPDETATEDEGDDWSVVDVEPVKAMAAPVGLHTIKATKALANMALLKRSRLSVVPVTAAEWKTILKLGKTSV